MTREGLGPSDLDRVFPFHVAVDRDLRVTQIGRSLAKVLPQLAIGARLFDVCVLDRPREPLTYEVLRDRCQDLCVLSANHHALVLKGQIIVRDDADVLLFLGSPRLTTADELSNLGITIDDFGIHDAIVDFLFLSHAQQSALAEVREMAERLAAQRREVREAHQRITTLYVASRVFADSPSLAIALQVLVPSLAKTLGCTSASAWRQQEDRLICDIVFPERDRIPALRLGMSRGMIAGIFATGEPMWLPTGHNLADGIIPDPQPDSIDPPTIRYSGVLPVVPVCGLPVIDGGRVVGVIAFVAPTTIPRSDDLLYLLGEIATNLTKFTTHLRTTTELAAARDAALASVRAKTEFLANVSHEIRTPLSAVIGLSTVLHGMHLRPPASAVIDDIQTAGRTLLRLVDDLLDESRIDAGKLSIELATFDLVALVRAVASPLQATAALRNLPVAVELAPELRSDLIGDHVRIGQILTNLIGNAVKFTQRGEVRVRVRCVDADATTATLTVAVSDTGIGINADQLERVFEPFTQADGSTTRKFGGAGLGLSITRRLLTLMGGTIAVTSTPGSGSTFTVELRLARAPVDLAPTSATAPGSPNTSRTRTQPALAPAGTPTIAARRRVLVVEDNPLGQRTTRLMIEQLGHDVEVVGDGAAAIEAVRRTSYDLVLMDCHLPVLDGFQATAHIRALPAPTGAIPIVACTASVMIDERRRCFAVGMDDVVIKPLSPAELRRVIESTPPPATHLPATKSLGHVLDLARIEMLRELLDGNRQVALDQMIALFRAHAPEYLASIEIGARSRDLVALRRAAHGLHGMSLNVGASALARACADVERGAATGSLSSIDPILSSYQEVLTAFAALVGTA
ncbi:MAG: ATP-binding protein [Proteobacteria bacterium]|nr:ATP-binding protein [Pseudomonadota bacterium]